MKYFIVIFVLILSISFAKTYNIGSSIEPFELKNQFGKKYYISVMPKMMLFANEKDPAGMVNSFLKTKPKNYLEQNKVLWVSDISGMPSLVTKWFALPKMRKYPFEVLLSNNEKFAKQFLTKEEHITAMLFDANNTIQEIHYISDIKTLQKMIEKKDARF